MNQRTSQYLLSNVEAIDMHHFDAIHIELDTPIGSTQTMKAWAIAKMREIANGSKLAQDATMGGGSLNGPSAPPQSDSRAATTPGNGIEEARRDIRRLLEWIDDGLDVEPWLITDLRKKWGIK